MFIQTCRKYLMVVKHFSQLGPHSLVFPKTPSSAVSANIVYILGIHVLNTVYPDVKTGPQSKRYQRAGQKDEEPDRKWIVINKALYYRIAAQGKYGETFGNIIERVIDELDAYRLKTKGRVRGP